MRDSGSRRAASEAALGCSPRSDAGREAAASASLPVDDTPTCLQDGPGALGRDEQEDGCRVGESVGALSPSASAHSDRPAQSSPDDAAGWVHVASYLGEDLTPLAATRASSRCLGHFQMHMLCTSARWTEGLCSLCEACVQCHVSEHTHSFVNGCAVLRYGGLSPAGAPCSYAWVPSVDVLVCASCAAMAPDQFCEDVRRAYSAALECSSPRGCPIADVGDLSRAASAAW